MRKVALAMTALLFFVPLSAVATTVTFNNTASTGTATWHGSNGVYVESGYTFTGTGDTDQYSLDPAYDLTNAPPDNSDFETFENGSPNGWTLTGSGPFSLTSLQAAAIYGDSANTLTLTGHKNGGGTVVQVLNLPADFGTAQWNTYALSGSWTNLNSVDFAYSGQYVGIDNVNLGNTASAIPTLSQWGMIILSFMLALAALSGLRRRPA